MAIRNAAKKAQSCVEDVDVDVSSESLYTRC